MRWYTLGVVWALLAVGAAAEDEAQGAQEEDLAVVAVKDFTFAYAVDGENLVGRVSYPTKGWVAVGFHPKKKMEGANLIVGSSSADGSVVQDHYGEGPTRHRPDTALGGADNLIASSCAEEEGVTTVSFTIPLDSGDEKDGVIERGKETKVIFAAGKKDSFEHKHAAVAKTTITF
jgi:hypothetical protein